MIFEGFIEIKPGIWYCEKDGTPWSNNNNRYGFRSYLKPLSTKTNKNNRYVQIIINKKHYKWHILVYKHFKGDVPQGEEIDHFDNIRSNNLIDNLQPKPHSNNCRKCLKYKKNTSSYAGVSYYKKTDKWKVQIAIDKKPYHLGYFDDPLEAFICYLENKIYYHGWDSILPLI